MADDHHSDDLEDYWADVRPQSKVFRWALEVEPVPNPCAEIPLGDHQMSMDSEPPTGIEQLALRLGVDVAVLSQPNLPREGPRTVSAWFRSESAGPQPIASLTGDGGYDLQLWEGHIIFQADRMLTTHQTFNDGLWHHVVVVDTMAVYVDGALVSFRTDEPARIRGETAFAIYIDDVSVWDRELSPGEVATVYNGGQPREDLPQDEALSNGLVAHYRLDGADPTPFDEPVPLTNRPIRGFSNHRCEGLVDGEVCQVCGRVFWTPVSRYKRLMEDDEDQL